MWFFILIGSVITLGVVLRIMLALQIAKRTGVHPVRQILNMWFNQPDKSNGDKNWLQENWMQEKSRREFCNPIYSYLPSNIYHNR